MVTFSMTLTEP